PRPSSEALGVAVTRFIKSCQRSVIYVARYRAVGFGVVCNKQLQRVVQFAGRCHQPGIGSTLMRIVVTPLYMHSHTMIACDGVAVPAYVRFPISLSKTRFHSSPLTPNENRQSDSVTLRFTTQLLLALCVLAFAPASASRRMFSALNSAPFVSGSDNNIR